MSTETQGEWIDKLSIEEIIRKDNFVSLAIFHGIGSPDYWEITFESNVRGSEGLYVFNSSKSPHKYFRFYKLKT